MALSWWNTVEDSVTTWERFKALFRDRFASESLIEGWWSELDHLRQAPDQTAMDVVQRLQDLFGRLNVGEDSQKVRYLRRALRSEKAILVDQLCAGSPKTWKRAMEAAAATDSMEQRYSSLDHEH
jgi:hypothetical protein